MEISCSRYGRSIHLLGYLVDPDHPGLAAEIGHAREARVSRLRRMVEKMSADGIGITYADVVAQVPEGATEGRPHIADALVANGIVATRDEAFRRWLANDSPYYVRHYAPDPVDAVRLVVEAGGVAVHAHPFGRGRGAGAGDAVIEEMAAAGLTALEVDHRDHDEAAREHGRRAGRPARPPRHRLQRLPRRRQGEPARREHHGAGRPRRDRGSLQRRGPGAAMTGDLSAALTVFVSTLITLIVIMDPPGAVPIFLALTARMTPAERSAAARRASLVAFGVIALFAIFGQRILDYLHVSLAALQGAGGLLLLLVALQLLTGQESEAMADAGVNVAMVPLGTPLLAGPGAIVAMMLAVQQAGTAAGVAGFVAVGLALLGTMAVVYLFLRFATVVRRVLGESGTVLATRIAGLLLSAIAVQMVASAVRAFVETGV